MADICFSFRNKKSLGILTLNWQNYILYRCTADRSDICAPILVFIGCRL